jgi:hypothetical protein
MAPLAWRSEGTHVHALKTYEQTAVFDPTDPTQRIRTVYTALPGGYGSFYWNVQPNESSLQGLGAGMFDSLPNWAQIGLVGGLAALAGFYGMKRYGDSYVKPVLRKVPIVGGMLSGPRHRRRRR